MASSENTPSEYSADVSGYSTARPRANPTPNQERTISDDLESNHNVSVEPTSNSDSSETSSYVVPRPTPTVAETSRGPRIRVMTRRSVLIPRRAFVNGAETSTPLG